ncbi:hypothetical protein PTTG_05427 [Puccinia triticina 1-1 BBBD Race 1]|uniref:Secreted protein n=2 Tax=Puccinia triticina TaxID=208348 RepID=A0A0C4EX79_PUCT1|nr:uncharacterized protein PtA15_6A533 [Puccinia triticina]OAV95366.1 hypothetical protein PTTG_05427 [Puccinia triticina 1-1 BBBD Race 1]WAQ85904.1 hypothetical protein PtA15_6A533 [Puccinia triticina]WAR55798.1 hypothetical protein PtB15_6B541 [Puccinia triticina]
MTICKKMTSFFWLVLCILSHFASANWDEATGHLRDFKPSNDWLSRNRLQLFATFTVQHADDNYHGCPYGICCAYTVLPSPRDFVADFTNAHSFFWHNLGGMPGLGTNPIRDPQTGQPGYETSDGVFHVGPPNSRLRQNGHDSHYPGFRLPPAWPRVGYPDWMTKQPAHPKCGVPNGPNRDPGQQRGGQYKPAPAVAYSPPKISRLPIYLGPRANSLAGQ